MKFFTSESWSKVLDSNEGHNPFKLYRQHLERIRDRVPADLIRIDEEFMLHDAELRNLHIDVTARELRMLLDGDDGSGGARRFELLYRGVSAFEVKPSEEDDAPIGNGLGYLGYWEVDVVNDGLELCLLFANGIELRVVFEDFKMEFSDTNDSTSIDPENEGGA